MLTSTEPHHREDIGNLIPATKLFKEFWIRKGGLERFPTNI